MKSALVELNFGGNSKEYKVFYYVRDGEVTLFDITLDGNNCDHRGTRYLGQINKARLIYKKICKQEGVKPWK